MWSTFFCAVNITGELNNFVQISICKIKPELSGNIEILSGNIEILSCNIEILSGNIEILSGYIEILSGNIESKKKADNILEMLQN